MLQQQQQQQQSPQKSNDACCAARLLAAAAIDLRGLHDAIRERRRRYSQPNGRSSGGDEELAVLALRTAVASVNGARTALTALIPSIDRRGRWERK